MRAQEFPSKFSIKKVGSKRTVMKSLARGKVNPIIGADPSSKWEIRTSTTPYLRCVYHSGEPIQCAARAYHRGFVSQDGRKLIAYTEGSPVGPGTKPTLHFFTPKGLVKEMLLSPFGNMYGVAATAKNVFFVAHESTGGVVVGAYNFDGESYWTRRFPGMTLAMASEKKAALAEGGDKFILTLDGKPAAQTIARTLIFNLDGKVVAEMSRPGIIEKLTGQEKLLIWSNHGYSIYDSKANTETTSVEFPRDGARHFIRDVSSDGKKVLIVREREENFRKGINRKIEKAMIVDLLGKTVTESEIGEEVHGRVRVGFSPGSNESIDLELTSQTIRHELK